MYMAAKDKEKKTLPKGIYKRGEVFWIRYAGIDGKTYYESTRQGDLTGTKLKEAMALLYDRKADVGRGKQPETAKILPTIAFRDFAKDYLEWAKRQRAFRQKEAVVNQLVNVFGPYPLRAFTPKLLEQYQSDRLTSGKRIVKEGRKAPANKPATINRHLATIKHMFTKAAEWELIAEDTLKRIRKVKLLKEDNRRLRYLSVPECADLVSECGDHLKPIVVMALNTGMRRGEILNLRWQHVDLKHGFILLDRTKNGERREIPISDTLRLVLKAIPRRLDVPHVFYDPRTDKPYGDVNEAFSGACRRAKITDFRFHDLRHTFASHLVMAGVDLTTVRELLGHKTLQMTLRYAHLAPAHKMQAINVIDKTLSETNYTKTIQLKGK